jgi:hypothetical protein
LDGKTTYIKKLLKFKSLFVLKTCLCWKFTYMEKLLILKKYLYWKKCLHWKTFGIWNYSHWKNYLDSKTSWTLSLKLIVKGSTNPSTFKFFSTYGINCCMSSWKLVGANVDDNWNLL